MLQEKSSFQGLSILIIGGKGEIGRTFVKAFRKIHLTVYILDKGNQGSLLKYLNLVQIVIISVPISETASTIKKVAPLLRAEQLLMDFTSIKKDFVHLMKTNTIAEIISLHPLFGPLKHIQNQNIILMNVRSKKFYPRVKKMLNELELKIVEIEIEEHDKSMTIIQSLIHLMALSLVTTIDELQFSFKKLHQISTPLYRLHIDLASRLLYQSAELYTDISFLNPYLEKVGSAFQKNLNFFLKTIATQDRKKFIATFEEKAKLLENKKEAFLRSEKVMEHLAKLK